MAEAWQSAWVEVLPDFREFTRKANTEIVGTLGAAGKAGGFSFRSGFGSVLGGVLGANILTGIGFAIGRTIKDAIGAGIQTGLDSIQLASSLGEQVNAVRVQFGDLADEILDLSKRAPQDLNLTQTAFNKLAVRFASFAKTVAGRGGKASDVIQELTQRGADFASVYDIGVDEALTLFQSGLAGETEPLRRFGLDLSEASVKAYAYANGIAAQGVELTEAQKIQARYGALLQQTNSVQGDLANTSGSLANVQRSLSVAFEEAQTKLGGFLLPAFTSAAVYIKENLSPRLSELIDRVGPKLAAALEQSSPKVQELLDKVIPLAEKFATMAVDGIPDAIQGFEDLTVIIDRVSSAWQALDDFVSPGGAGDIVGKFQNGADQLGDFFDGVLLPGLEGIGADTKTFLEGPGSLEQAGADWTMGFGEGVQASTSEVLDSVLTVTDTAKKPITQFSLDSFRAGAGVSDGLAKGILSGRDKVGLAAQSVAERAVAAVKKAFDNRSPSHVMEREGTDAIAGLVKGWESEQLAPPRIPSLSIPRVGAFAGGAAFTSLDPSGMRLLRDLAERVVQLNVDGQVLAKGAVAGNARLASLGAS